jgi:hypothetical protein
MERTRFGALLLVLLLPLGGGGCAGAEANTKVATGEAAPAAPAPPPPPPSTTPADATGVTTNAPLVLALNDPGPAKSVSDSPHSAAMLIYTANLALAVYQVEPGLDAVERVAREAGGYLSSRQDNAVTIRVPRDRFGDVLTRIEKLGDVTHRDIKAQDVTDEFVDLQARLKNAYAIRDRLNDLLSRAPVKEALEIEKELGRVTEDIERMEGKLKLLRDQMAYSTITVTFSPHEQDKVQESSLLAPFPWLRDLGLHSLLNVHQ